MILCQPPAKKPTQNEHQAKMEEGRRNISQLIEDNRDALAGDFITTMVDNMDSGKTPEDLRDTWKLLKTEISRIRKLEQKDREAQALEKLKANGGKDEMLEKIKGLEKGADLPTVDTEAELDIF